MWKYKILLTKKLKQKAYAHEGKLLHLLQLSFQGKAVTPCAWQAGNLRVPADFAVFAVPGVGEGWPSVQKCFLLATKFCRAGAEVKPNIHSHPTTVRLNLIHKQDDDSWDKGSFLAVKQAILSTWLWQIIQTVSYLMKALTNVSIKDSVSREGGWSLVLTCCGPLWAGKNQTLEREGCFNTYINNRVKEVFIFSNRLWAKDFYLLFLFS